MKKSGWVDVVTVCEDSKKINYVPADTDCSSQTPKVTDASGPLGAILWAGKIRRLYYDVSKGEFTNLEILVTCYSPSGSYYCGQIITRKPKEIKDFDKTSLNLRKCH
jgi:hypothetical protein